MSTYERNQMKNDPRSCECNLCYYIKKPEKKSGLKQGLNPRPCDTSAMLEPTELWSHWRWEQVNIVGSYVPVKEMSVIYIL